jgi:Asp-tRNA(Asn)/Glu-tRNA(Gln) amidotransferase A subunit family amidase
MRVAIGTTEPQHPLSGNGAIGAKDVIVTKGVKTTCGSRLLAGYIPRGF